MSCDCQELTVERTIYQKRDDVQLVISYTMCLNPLEDDLCRSRKRSSLKYKC